MPTHTPISSGIPNDDEAGVDRGVGAGVKGLEHIMLDVQASMLGAQDTTPS